MYNSQRSSIHKKYRFQANNINPDIAIETFQENMLSKGSVKAIVQILQSNYSQVIDYFYNHKTDIEIMASKNLTNHIIEAMSKKWMKMPNGNG